MCCIFRYRLSLVLHGDATELFDQMGLASALEGDSSQCIVRYHMYDVFFTFPTHQQLKSDRIHMICPKCFLIIFFQKPLNLLSGLHCSQIGNESPWKKTDEGEAVALNSTLKAWLGRRQWHQNDMTYWRGCHPGQKEESGAPWSAGCWQLVGETIRANIGPAGVSDATRESEEYSPPCAHSNSGSVCLLCLPGSSRKRGLWR